MKKINIDFSIRGADDVDKLSRNIEDLRMELISLLNEMGKIEDREGIFKKIESESTPEILSRKKSLKDSVQNQMREIEGMTKTGQISSVKELRDAYNELSQSVKAYTLIEQNSASLQNSVISSQEKSLRNLERINSEIEKKSKLEDIAARKQVSDTKENISVKSSKLEMDVLKGRIKTTEQLDKKMRSLRGTIGMLKRAGEDNSKELLRAYKLEQRMSNVIEERIEAEIQKQQAIQESTKLTQEGVEKQQKSARLKLKSEIADQSAKIQLDVAQKRIKTIDRLDAEMASLRATIEKLKSVNASNNAELLKAHKLEEQMLKIIRQRIAQQEQMATVSSKASAGLGSVTNRQLQLTNASSGMADVQRQANYALQNTAYIAQDMFYGLRGITNNVQSTTFAFIGLSKAIKENNERTGETKGIFESLLSMSKSGAGGFVFWATIVASALTIVMEAWVQISQKIDQAEKKRKAFNKGIEEMAGFVAKTPTSIASEIATSTEEDFNKKTEEMRKQLLLSEKATKEITGKSLDYYKDLSNAHSKLSKDQKKTMDDFADGQISKAQAIKEASRKANEEINKFYRNNPTADRTSKQVVENNRKFVEDSIKDFRIVIESLDDLNEDFFVELGVTREGFFDSIVKYFSDGSSSESINETVKALLDAYDAQNEVNNGLRNEIKLREDLAVLLKDGFATDKKTEDKTKKEKKEQDYLLASYRHQFKISGNINEREELRNKIIKRRVELLNQNSDLSPNQKNIERINITEEDSSLTKDLYNSQNILLENFQKEQNLITQESSSSKIKTLGQYRDEEINLYKKYYKDALISEEEFKLKKLEIETKYGKEILTEKQKQIDQEIALEQIRQQNEPIEVGGLGSLEGLSKGIESVLNKLGAIMGTDEDIIKQAQIDREKILHEKRIEAAELIKNTIERNRQIELLEKQHKNNLQQIDQDYNQSKVQIYQQATTAITGGLEFLAESIGRNSKAGFYIAKLAAMGQATVNAWLAYTSFLAQAPPNPVAAKWALASGLMAVAKIAATPFGGSSGGSAGASGITSGYRGYSFQSNNYVPSYNSVGAAVSGERSSSSQSITIKDGFGKIVARGSMENERNNYTDNGYWQ